MSFLIDLIHLKMTPYTVFKFLTKISNSYDKVSKTEI